MSSQNCVSLNNNQPVSVNDGGCGCDNGTKQNERLPAKMSRRRHRVELAEKLKQKEGNPIGALQTICTYCKWPSPIYEQVAECGLAHRKEYALSVTVDCYNVCGTGFSKKEAKKNAASEMCKLLHPIVFKTKKSVSAVTGSSSSQATSDPPQSDISDYHKLFKKTNGHYFKKLATLQFDDLDFDYVAFLDDLKEEQSFILFYLSHNEIDGCFDDFYMFLFLGGTQSFIGKGSSYEKARTRVAKKALERLQQIQSRKSTSE